jgi:hypothetical protein
VILPPAVTPNDDLAVILQAATLGALLGTAVAARRRRGDPGFDAWLVTARWSVAAGIVGVLIVATRRLGWW